MLLSMCWGWPPAVQDTSWLAANPLLVTCAVEKEDQSMGCSERVLRNDGSMDFNLPTVGLQGLPCPSVTSPQLLRYDTMWFEWVCTLGFEIYASLGFSSSSEVSITGGGRIMT